MLLLLLPISFVAAAAVGEVIVDAGEVMGTSSAASLDASGEGCRDMIGGGSVTREGNRNQLSSCAILAKYNIARRDVKPHKLSLFAQALTIW